MDHQGRGVYQEVHYSRAGDGKQGFCGACACSLIGLFLYFGCLAGIAVNEVSTVCVSKALEYARHEHEEVRCAAQDPTGRADLVYFACPVSDRSMQTFTPREFSGAQWLDGAFATKAVKVSQQVSMYQCVETRNEREEKGRNEKEKITIVSWEYALEWKDGHIDAKQFKAWENSEARHALERGCGQGFKGNPDFQMRSQELSTNVLYAGDYDVSRHLGSVSVSTPVQLKQGSYAHAPAGLTSTGSGRRVAKDGQSYTRGQFIDHYGEDRGVQEWNAAHGAGESVEVFGDTVKTCAGQPVPGCLRVTYKQSSITHASLMAALSKTTKGATKAWAAPPSWMCSSSSSSSHVDIFEEGSIAAHRLVDNAQSSNTAQTWMIRGVCFLLVIVGIYAFLQPIQAIADMIDQFLDWFKFIPILGWGLDFLGDVVSGAVGMAIFFISIGIGAPSAFAVMSISWLVMRPIVGIPMVLACAGLLVMTAQAMIKYARIGRAKREKKS